jgi:hypothetical protein
MGVTSTGHLDLATFDGDVTLYYLHSDTILFR